MKILIISADSDIGASLQSLHRLAGDEVVATSHNKKTPFHLELAHPMTWPNFDVDSFDRLYYTIGIGDGRASRIEVMQVNAFLSLDCITRYQNCLKDGGEMVVLTSGWSSITELRSGKAPVYRMSKAALNMGIAIKANNDSRLKWILMHPGLVSTKMTKYLNTPLDMITADDSAKGIMNAVPKVTKHFSFVDYTGREVPF